MGDRADIEAMIARVALGDRAAFARLYEATSAKLFGVCLRVLNDRPDAEEALQEVYVRVWRHAGRYRSNGLSPMTWLIAIARNHAVDRVRARRGGGQGMDTASDLPDAGPGPEALAIASSDRARIVACMAELPPDRAEAVRRVYLEGDTYRDLAARLDVPVNTVRTWLRRSLRRLRECLSR